MRIVIVGAGVAGCVMARRLALLSGIEVVCLERVVRDDHSEAGTGLNIGPNAVKALTAIDPELAESITRASFPWRNWRISLTDGAVLFDLALARVAEGPGWRIRWSELYRVLREAAGSSIAYGCEITQIRRDPADASKTSIRWMQNGEDYQLDGIDLLIAADGRYSKVRRTMSGEPLIRHIGVSIFRLLVPDTSNGLIGDYEQWFNGPNRLLSFRVPPDHIYIAGTFPISPQSSIAESLKEPDALCAAYTPKTAPPSAQARWMIDAICENAADTHWARMQEHEMLYRAAGCNVLYLGDAAHGMVPTLGQGATQAIEDSANAAELIAQRYSSGDNNIDGWLSEFDALRAARMRFVMEFSLDATDTMLDGADPVEGTKHKNEEPFQSRLKILYRDIGLPLDGNAQ